MNRGDAIKLLGGYATGTLTDEERRALFDAALADQELFNALGDEQALKELLDDPAARGYILANLDRPRRRWFSWPVFAGSAGAIAAAVIIVVALHQPQLEEPRRRVEATRPFVPPPATQAEAPAELAVPPKLKVSGAQAPAEIARVLPEPAAPPPHAMPRMARPAGVVGGVPGGVVGGIIGSAPSAFAPAPPAVQPVVRWTVLPTGADYRAGQTVRLQIEAPAVGTITLRVGDKVLYSGIVVPSRPTEVPVTLTAGEMRITGAFVGDRGSLRPAFARDQAAAPAPPHAENFEIVLTAR